MKERARLSGASDRELLEFAKAGCSDAFGELWRRHSQAVLAATQSFTGLDPDDVAQEAFLRVLSKIRGGQGPQTAFRAYVIMTARNVAINMWRKRSTDEVDVAEDHVFEALGYTQQDIAGEILFNTAALSVFSSLPARWQEVLWYCEVEDRPVHELSARLGISENATSALLKRARAGFRKAWIVSNS